MSSARSYIKLFFNIGVTECDNVVIRSNAKDD